MKRDYLAGEPSKGTFISSPHQLNSVQDKVTLLCFAPACNSLERVNTVDQIGVSAGVVREACLFALKRMLEKCGARRFLRSRFM